MPNDEMTVQDAYWLGYRHGVRTLEHTQYLVDLEENLKLEVHLVGAGATPMTRRHRAFALGELRGYRQARDD